MAGVCPLDDHPVEIEPDRNYFQYVLTGRQTELTGVTGRDRETVALCSENDT